jgi:hypothetical protein
MGEGWPTMSTWRDQNDPKVKKAKVDKVAENKQLTAQTRRILGKHYANKYRTGRR